MDGLDERDKTRDCCFVKNSFRSYTSKALQARHLRPSGTETKGVEEGRYETQARKLRISLVIRSETRPAPDSQVRRSSGNMFILAREVTLLA